jgi:hypothetical protein
MHLHLDLLQDLQHVPVGDVVDRRVDRDLAVVAEEGGVRRQDRAGVGIGGDVEHRLAAATPESIGQHVLLGERLRHRVAGVAQHALHGLGVGLVEHVHHVAAEGLGNVERHAEAARADVVCDEPRVCGYAWIRQGGGRYNISAGVQQQRKSAPCSPWLTKSVRRGSIFC